MDVNSELSSEYVMNGGKHLRVLTKKDTEEYKQQEAKAIKMAQEIETNGCYKSRIQLENGDEEDHFCTVVRMTDDAPPSKVLLTKKDTEEYKQQKAKAIKIAQEIETNGSYKSRIQLENGDEEDRFSTVVRTTDDAPPSNSRHDECQYLELIQRILERGYKREDRTGTGTLSVFGTQSRYNLRDGTFPLLTTKKVFWRAICEELLWFISGSTNANVLKEKNIHIWDGNSSKEYMASINLSYPEEGDLGPVYGFQWRHFGAKYEDMSKDYTGQGVDQLANVINLLKTKPYDRRIIMSAWNCIDIPRMALPPCHCFVQFYVANGELSCLLFQRSGDMGLGVPFNIASYSLLTYMIAHVTDLKPGELIHTIGDAHIYLNHTEVLKEQIKRVPKPFPKLKIKREVQSIDDFKYDDFEIVGYEYHPPLKMKMAV